MIPKSGHRFSEKIMLQKFKRRGQIFSLFPCHASVFWFVIRAGGDGRAVPQGPPPSRNRRRAMIRWFFRRQIAAFERTWTYDASYIHELIEADPRAFMAFGKIMGLGEYRKDIPAAALHAARIVSVMAEDCGPCTQLTI